MAKATPTPQPQALATVQPGGGLAATMPEHLRTMEGPGNLEQIKKYIILPRLKVVQPLSGEPFKPPYNEGDVIASPVMIPVSLGAKPGDTIFHLVPILFYPEWITWNPRSAGMKAMRDRSLDPTSTIAIKARSAETRKENCPDAPLKEGKPQQMKHLEHLNFVFDLVVPEGQEHELAGMPLTISFASGEHQAGSRFSTLISTRKVKASYGCQFAAKLGFRKNEQGKWYGIDIDNPDPASGVSPWVTDPERFARYQAAWREYQDAYDLKRLQVNMDDMESPDADTVGAPVSEEKRF